MLLIFRIPKEWVDIIQSAGVIASILFTGYQIKTNAKIVRSQIFNSVYQRLDHINSMSFEKPKVLSDLLHPYNHNENQFKNTNSYIDTVNTFFYELFYHKNKGLLVLNEWDSWKPLMHDFYSKPYVQGYWENKFISYPNDFDNFINNLIAEIRNSN